MIANVGVVAAPALCRYRWEMSRGPLKVAPALIAIFLTALEGNINTTELTATAATATALQFPSCD